MHKIHVPSPWYRSVTAWPSPWLLNDSPTWEYQSLSESTETTLYRCNDAAIGATLHAPHLFSSFHLSIYIRARGWNTLCQTTNTNDEATLLTMLHASPTVTLYRCDTLSTAPLPIYPSVRDALRTTLPRSLPRPPAPTLDARASTRPCRSLACCARSS